MNISAVDKHLLDAGQDADQPHHSAGDHCIPLIPHSGCAQGVHNCKVSVKGQKSKKEDRTVEAQIVGTSNNLAHGCAKDPAGELQVGSHEGKATHEDQGGQHQVQQQDVGHSGQLLKPRKWTFKPLDGETYTRTNWSHKHLWQWCFTIFSNDLFVRVKVSDFHMRRKRGWWWSYQLNSVISMRLYLIASKTTS